MRGVSFMTQGILNTRFKKQKKEKPKPRRKRCFIRWKRMSRKRANTINSQHPICKALAEPKDLRHQDNTAWGRFPENVTHRSHQRVDEPSAYAGPDITDGQNEISGHAFLVRLVRQRKVSLCHADGQISKSLEERKGKVFIEHRC